LVHLGVFSVKAPSFDCHKPSEEGKISSNFEHPDTGGNTVGSPNYKAVLTGLGSDDFCSKKGCLRRVKFIL